MTAVRCGGCVVVELKGVMCTSLRGAFPRYHLVEQLQPAPLYSQGAVTWEGRGGKGRGGEGRGMVRHICMFITTFSVDLS